jgi:hypothetical protein
MMTDTKQDELKDAIIAACDAWYRYGSAKRYTQEERARRADAHAHRDQLIEALNRRASPQTGAEPVAHVCEDAFGRAYASWMGEPQAAGTELYTHPMRELSGAQISAAHAVVLQAGGYQIGLLQKMFDAILAAARKS